MLPAACSYRFHQTPKYADVPKTLHLSRSSVLSPLAVCSYMFPLHLGSHCYYDFHSQKVLQSFGACCFSPHHSLGNKTSHSADQEAPAKPPNKTIAPQSLSRSQTKALTGDRPRDASTISRPHPLPLACNAIIPVCWAYSTGFSGSTTLS